MLIEKPIEKNKIVSIKLITGDELVAKIIDETATDITVAKPLSVIMSDKGLAMLPYMLSVSADNDLKISKSHYICISSPVKEVESHYLQITTGITL